MNKDSNKSIRNESFKNDALREHDLVKKMLADTKNIGKLTVLVGYVGKSDNDQMIRLYTSLEFNSYLEIKRRDIINSEEVSEEVIEYGGTRIWVTGESDITQVTIESTTSQAKYLKGNISDKYVKPYREYFLIPERGDEENAPRDTAYTCHGTCVTCRGSCQGTCVRTCRRSCGGSCGTGCETMDMDC